MVMNHSKANNSDENCLWNQHTLLIWEDRKL